MEQMKPYIVSMTIILLTDIKAPLLLHNIESTAGTCAPMQVIKSFKRKNRRASVTEEQKSSSFQKDYD